MIVHSKLEELQKVSEKVTHWLEDLGLPRSPKKTRITHTLTPYQGHVGFDFLGFTFRQVPVGKTQTGKTPHGRPLGFKTYSRPSKEAVQRHTLTIKRPLHHLRSASQEDVIKDLNPIIWGWAAYYQTANSSRTFKRCDHRLWGQLRGWARARHRHKGTRWIVAKDWHRVGKRKWVLATPNEAELRMHSKTHIQRYTKVKRRASPYDGNTLYWSQRLKTHPLMQETKARLLQRQQGKCRWCERYFKDGDILEIDHLDRDRNNNDLSNKMLLHRHCHAERHAKWMAAEKLHRLASAGVYLK